MSNLYYLFSVKEKCYTDLAVLLKEKKLFSKFYGLAYAKTPVLKHPVYTHISYISNITQCEGIVDYVYLKNIEKTYQVNIAEMIHADRHLRQFNKQKRLFIAQELIRVFTQEVMTYQISLVIPSATADFISYFAAFFCKHHHIPFFYPINVGYAELSCLSSNINAEPNDFEKHFHKTLQQIAQGSLDLTATEKAVTDYINKKSRPAYYITGHANYNAFKPKDIGIFFQYLTDYLRDKNALYYDRNPLLLPLHRAVKIARKLRYRKFIKNESWQPDQLSHKKYFIYPLHFEPEASTLVLGRWLNDQRKIIEMISKSLPVDTLLIVKEHKPSIGRRPLQWYKDIAAHHNVFFVDDQIDTYSLIRQSKGVIVISSTMGIEALMLQKPVMAFGDRCYTVSNNVYKVSNYRTVRETIQQMLTHQFDSINAMAFFHTLFATTTYLGCLSHLNYTQDDLEILCKAIMKILPHSEISSSADVICHV